MTRGQASSQRSGVILVIVLVVIALVALSAYTFTDRMLANHAAADVHMDLAQSRLLTQSAAASSRALLMLPLASRQQMGGVFNNPQLYQQQTVVADSDPLFAGHFTVLAPIFDPIGSPAGLRFGLQNESAKLNLNTLVEYFEDTESAEEAALSALVGTLSGDGDPSDDEPADEGEDALANVDPTQRDILMQLPGMTVETADAILDWMDEDDVPREFGAEIDYYSTLPTPYLPRNGPLATLEELLMVRGVTPDLLFGRDQDRNGIIDVLEAQRPLPVDLDPTLGSIDLGWLPYLTIVSQEIAVDPLGEPKLDINDSDLEALYAELTNVIEADLATFIIAFRQNGPYDSDGDGGGGDGSDRGEDPPNQDGAGPGNGSSEAPIAESVNGRTIDLTAPARATIDNLLDLVGVQVRATLSGDEEPTVLESPLSDNPQAETQSLFAMFDFVTTDGDAVVPGRININEAPRPVLMSLPGMTQEAVDVIVSQAYTGADRLNSNRRHPVWLWTEGLVPLEAMRQMLPYVTGGGDVFLGHAVGYFGDGRRISRVEFVIDATLPQVPVVRWKDMQASGRGYLPEQLVGQVVGGETSMER